MDGIIWIQDTAFSIWMRESSWAIFAFLIVHTLSMAFILGLSVLTALAAFGDAKFGPLSPLTGFSTVRRTALVVAIITGIALVWGYPAKALTNPDFYLKLILIAVALWLTRRLSARLAGDRAITGAPDGIRTQAVVLVLLWAGVVASGRLLAYTHHMLLAY